MSIRRAGKAILLLCAACLVVGLMPAVAAAGPVHASPAARGPGRPRHALAFLPRRVYVKAPVCQTAIKAEATALSAAARPPRTDPKAEATAAGLAPSVRSDAGDVRADERTVVLADPGDVYYPLAQEIARAEGLELYPTLDAALAADPVFLLWVVSPAGLSDAALMTFARGLQAHPSAVSTGIISGQSLASARALWQRADQVGGEYLVSASAANPDAHIAPQITETQGAHLSQSALTYPNLLGALQRADYMTFTGHGGTGYLRLDAHTTLRPADVPALHAAVVASGSCNSFRPWEPDSIALAFVERGAAAYAGFAYSPNEGFLFGEFGGLPFRYTWPDFPIGQVVQIQNRGALQGFASLPYYFLLGDPRIALASAPAYRLVASHETRGVYSIDYADAPAGLIPVRVDGGARYPFVRIPGVGAAWRGGAVLQRPAADDRRGQRQARAVRSRRGELSAPALRQPALAAGRRRHTARRAGHHTPLHARLRRRAALCHRRHPRHRPGSPPAPPP
jgi:hypothetical protein